MTVLQLQILIWKSGFVEMATTAAPQSYSFFNSNSSVVVVGGGGSSRSYVSNL